MATTENAMENTAENRPDRGRRAAGGGGSGALYGIGAIGALVYYIQQADGFWSGVLGVLKALVWPAFLVYHALRALHG